MGFFFLVGTNRSNLYPRALVKDQCNFEHFHGDSLRLDRMTCTEIIRTVFKVRFRSRHKQTGYSFSSLSSLGLRSKSDTAFVIEGSIESG